MLCPSASRAASCASRAESCRAASAPSCRRLLLAYTQLRLCIFIGRLLRKRLHLRDQLLLFLREGGRFSRLRPGFSRAPSAVPHRVPAPASRSCPSLGAWPGRLRRMPDGAPNRTPGTARPPASSRAENTGLRVKESAAALAVCCVRLLRRVLRTQISPAARQAPPAPPSGTRAAARSVCACFSFTLLRFGLLCAQFFAALRPVPRPAPTLRGLPSAVSVCAASSEASASCRCFRTAS